MGEEQQWPIGESFRKDRVELVSLPNESFASSTTPLLVASAVKLRTDKLLFFLLPSILLNRCDAVNATSKT